MEDAVGVCNDDALAKAVGDAGDDAVALAVPDGKLVVLSDDEPD